MKPGFKGHSTAQKDTTFKIFSILQKNFWGMKAAISQLYFVLAAD
jgi:hypothetical protein